MSHGIRPSLDRYRIRFPGNAPAPIPPDKPVPEASASGAGAHPHEGWVMGLAAVVAMAGAVADAAAVLSARAADVPLGGPWLLAFCGGSLALLAGGGVLAWRCKGGTDSAQSREG